MPLRSINMLLTTLLAIVVSVDATTAQSRQGKSVELDIPFVAGRGHDQQLDLYIPVNADFPTILFVHKGSLTSGDRKDEPYARMCQTFQALGFGCAAANYRLAPRHKWPAQPNDVVAAFGWLKQNIRSRGGDPKRIFLFGHSSGCHLVTIVAADARYLTAQGWRPHDIAGIVAMGCRLNDFVEVRATPPTNYESSWVLIAEAERFFPPVLRDAAEFVGRAQAAGAKVDLAILADRKHMTAIQMMVTPTDPAVLHVSAFVRAH